MGTILDRPAQVVSLLAPGGTPFRGLLPFDVGNAHLFFGRDRETEELLEKLRVAPFLAVIGESGSGKSSLVRAGLVPALHRGRVGDGREGIWRTLVMRPGKDPFRELSNTLPGLVPDIDHAQRMDVREACARQLGTGTDGLGGCVGSLVTAGQRTLLVVDQFEELFTQSVDTGERDRFIDTLLAGSDATGDRPVHIVITLRADFYSHCFEHPTLPEIISTNQYPVRAIDRTQLVEVIEKPAAMAGAQLQPGLVDAILHDVGAESASLALLEHTLLELWKLRSGGTLTHESYESIGRVQGALEHHAEDVFGALDAQRQTCAKRLMLNLGVPGDGGTVTRRPVARDELLQPGETGGPTEQVLQHLIEQRLLTVRQGADGADGATELVEVAHEALLRGWLDEDREFLLWRQRTRTAFQAWEESGRDQGVLLRGGPLAEAQRWLRERAEDMGEAGRTFIAESVARAQRALRLKQAAMATIAALAVVAAGSALVARNAKARADKSFDQATKVLRQVGEMTAVGGGAEAEQSEVVELRAGVAREAIAFYEELDGEGAITESLQLQQAVAQYRLGNILSVQGEEDESEAAFDEAISILEGLPDSARYRRELANAHHWKGELLAKYDRWANAEDEYHLALAEQRELAEGSSAEFPGHRRLFELGRTLNSLGTALKNDEDWDEAKKTYEEARCHFSQAIEDAEASEVPDSYRQGSAWAFNGLALLHRDRGKEELDRGEETLAVAAARRWPDRGRRTSHRRGRSPGC